MKKFDNKNDNFSTTINQQTDIMQGYFPLFPLKKLFEELWNKKIIDQHNNIDIYLYREASNLYNCLP